MTSILTDSLCHPAHLILGSDSLTSMLCFHYHFMNLILIGIVSESNQFQAEFKKSRPRQLNTILSYFNLISMQFHTCPTPIIEWQRPTQHCAVLCCAVLC